MLPTQYINITHTNTEILFTNIIAVVNNYFVWKLVNQSQSHRLSPHMFTLKFWFWHRWFSEFSEKVTAIINTNSFAIKQNIIRSVYTQG